MKKDKSFITHLITATLAVLLTTYLLPGVHVQSAFYAILVALLLSVLNLFIKPLLIFLTLPFTLITFGLFLLVINAGIILIADHLLHGFNVDGFWWALLFSMVLSILISWLHRLSDRFNKSNN